MATKNVLETVKTFSLFMCGFQEKPFSESKSSLEIIVIIPPRSESLKEIKKDSGPSTLKK